MYIRDLLENATILSSSRGRSPEVPHTGMGIAVEPHNGVEAVGMSEVGDTICIVITLLHDTICIGIVSPGVVAIVLPVTARVGNDVGGISDASGTARIVVGVGPNFVANVWAATAAIEAAGGRGGRAARGAGAGVAHAGLKRPPKDLTKV